MKFKHEFQRANLQKHLNSWPTVDEELITFENLISCFALFGILIAFCLIAFIGELFYNPLCRLYTYLLKLVVFISLFLVQIHALIVERCRNLDSDRVVTFSE